MGNTARKKERIAEALALLVAGVCVIVGALLIIFHHAEHYYVMLGLGMLFIMFGIMHVTGYFLHESSRAHNRFDFSMGLFNIIIGSLLFFVSHKFAEHFSIVIALMLMFKAVTWLQTTVEMKEEDGKRFHIETVYAIILFVVGLGFAIYDFEAAHHSTVYHGVALIIEGVVEAFSVIEKRLAAKRREERK